MKVVDNKGFTLMQLIVSVSVLAILATSVFFVLNSSARLGKAKDIKRYEDITAIAKAIELYQLDNGSLPTSFTTSTISSSDKVVLCSSADSLTCDGLTTSCLVVDDVDFLDTYFGGSLPVDPDKTDTTDTGYYITRSGDKMTFGACTNYEGNDIEYIARATMTVGCGNGILEGDEVCDDGNSVTEGCGSGTLETASTNVHCNSTCTAYVDTINEVCDYVAWSGDCRNNSIWYETTAVGSGTYCNVTCTASYSGTCDDVPPLSE